jgi:glucose-6-phosphate isomerase
MVPADFLTAATSHNSLRASLHHRILLSNFFAQPEALAFGKTEEQVRSEVGTNATEALIKSKVFEGNHPSNSIIFPLLTPATLGSLIALYEHKIFTQGVIWGINSYGGDVVLILPNVPLTTCPRPNGCRARQGAREEHLQTTR